MPTNSNHAQFQYHFPMAQGTLHAQRTSTLMTPRSSCSIRKRFAVGNASLAAAILVSVNPLLLRPRLAFDHDIREYYVHSCLQWRLRHHPTPAKHRHRAARWRYLDADAETHFCEPPGASKIPVPGADGVSEENLPLLLNTSGVTHAA